MTRLTGIFLLVAVYCVLHPFDYYATTGSARTSCDIPIDEDPLNLLQKSEIKFSGQVQGPESLAFDPMGRGPYTGVADGRVVFWDGKNWVDFAYTSPNRSSLCDPKADPSSYMKNEHICGRPLGLRFDKSNGDLYIADAYFGLMKVGPKGGLAKSLATEAEGVPFKFTNDLDIDDQGIVYFTDSSAKYQRREYPQIIYTGDDSGRVLKYDPKTKETSVLVRNLRVPNGVSLSKDGSFFVLCETASGRLWKYWLKDEKAGEYEIMATLPLDPDNVRTNEEGDFWVATNCRKTKYSSYILAAPKYSKLRAALLKLLKKSSNTTSTCVGSAAIKYDEEGELLKILEDREQRVVRAISEVDERDGMLWMGSNEVQFIAVF